MIQFNCKTYVTTVLFSLIIFLLCSCSSISNLEKYEGKPLNIAIAGQLPSINETHINLEPITLNQLTSSHIQDFDAIFIMKDKFAEASTSDSAHFFSNLAIPVFFIGSYSHVPFTIADINYDETWNWFPGVSYVSGIHQSKSFGIELRNSEYSYANMTYLYSQLFDMIENI